MGDEKLQSHQCLDTSQLRPVLAGLKSDYAGAAAGVKWFEVDPQRMHSIASWDWIINSVSNEKQN